MRRCGTIVFWVSGLLLLLAVTALGDLAYKWEPYPYDGAMLPNPEARTVLGAGIGGVIVWIVLLPTLGVLLLVPSRRKGAMKWWAGMLLLGVAVLSALLLSGTELFREPSALQEVGKPSGHEQAWKSLVFLRQPGVLLAGFGGALGAAAALGWAMATKRKRWLFASAALALATMALHAALWRFGSIPDDRFAPVTRDEWNRIQRERERAHNEARRRMLEERHRELEWRHGDGGGE